MNIDQARAEYQASLDRYLTALKAFRAHTITQTELDAADVAVEECAARYRLALESKRAA